MNLSNKVVFIIGMIIYMLCILFIVTAYGQDISLKVDPIDPPSENEVRKDIKTFAEDSLGLVDRAIIKEDKSSISISGVFNVDMYATAECYGEPEEGLVSVFKLISSGYNRRIYNGYSGVVENSSVHFICSDTGFKFSASLNVERLNRRYKGRLDDCQINQIIEHVQDYEW